jgi:hypothetical protein
MTTETKIGWIRRLGLREGLVALGVVGAAFLLPGCFVDSGPGPAPVCGAGTITVGWFVTANNTSISCAQAGASEVDIIVDGMTAPFDCNGHVGTTPAVSGGANHNVSLVLLDGAGNNLSQTPQNSVFVPCSTDVDLGNIELSLTP